MLNSCLITETLTINEPPVLTSSTFVQDISCNNGTDGSIDLIINGGSSPYNTLCLMVLLLRIFQIYLPHYIMLPLLTRMVVFYKMQLRISACQ